MTIMRLFQFILILCFTISGNRLYADVDVQINAAMREALTHFIDENSLPGVVVTYGFADQPLQTIAVGFSDIESKNPMQSDTLFNVGSITKSFLSAAILEQVEAGKIAVDEPLSTIAQQYQGEIGQVVKQYPQLGEVTIREMLDHTSGVRDDINNPDFAKAFIANPKKIWTDQELLALAMAHPFYFKPGTPGTYSYTNTDYLLLSIVLKSVTHENVGANFNKLFAEAKLKQIYYPESGVTPHDLVSQMATGYLPVEYQDPLAPAFSDGSQLMIPGQAPLKAYALKNAYTVADPSAGGIIATTTAIASWYRALFEGNLLSPASIDLMLKGGVPISKNYDQRYGFGVMTANLPPYGYFVTHNGLNPGYSSAVFYFFKYHLVLAIATNSSNDSLNTFDVYTGKLIPGLMTSLMPVILPVSSS